MPSRVDKRGPWRGPDRKARGEEWPKDKLKEPIGLMRRPIKEPPMQRIKR